MRLPIRLCERLVIGVAVALAMLIASAGPAGAIKHGLGYTEDTKFIVMHDYVQVELTVVVTNNTRDERRGNTIYYSYFDEFSLPVPAGATELVVESRGRNLSPTFEEIDIDFDLMLARLPSRLLAGQSRTLNISYRLPVGENRSDGLFLSNPAFHSFPMFSFSDPGTGSVELWSPADVDMTEFGSELGFARSEETFAVWAPQSFDTPTEFFSYVTIRIDDELEIKEISVAGQQIILQAWPNDDEWVAFAEDTIRAGLPKLEELIGVPIPEQDSLEIIESVTPYFYGYAGWYDPAETEIEVGNELDDAVMLHEVSHAWFNDSLFTERWAAEGLAEEFTWRAQDALDWVTSPPPRVPTADVGLDSLVEWGGSIDFTLSEDEFGTQEEWGYNAAWWTMRQIVDTAGIDAVRGAIAAADQDEVSYLGSGPAEIVVDVDDWRRLLDLVVERSDVDGVDAALVELFRAQVVPDEAFKELDERAAARLTYDQFLVDGLDWRTPPEIRLALSDWRFDAAQTAIEDAIAVQERFEEVSALAAASALAISDGAKVAYEAEQPDYDLSHRLLDKQEASIDRVEAVRVEAATELNRAQRWGIGGVDLGDFVVKAEAAFTADEPEAIEVALVATATALAESERLGRQRLTNLALVGAALLLMATMFGLMWRRRRKAANVAITEPVMD